MLHKADTSFMKPKVRARDRSRRKVSGVMSVSENLVADQRRVEVDLDLDAEAVRVRPQFAKGLAARHTHRLQHFDIAAWRREGDEAGLVDGLHEGRRAAVHDRHFRTVELNKRVVDSEAAQGGENVFGSGAENAGGVAENGGEFGRGHRTVIGAHFALAA
jgi:hypothetical protein